MIKTYLEQLVFSIRELPKKEHDSVSFQILYPMIPCNKPFKSLKCC